MLAGFEFLPSEKCTTQWMPWCDNRVSLFAGAALAAVKSRVFTHRFQVKTGFESLKFLAFICNKVSSAIIFTFFPGFTVALDHDMLTVIFFRIAQPFLVAIFIYRYR